MPSLADQVYEQTKSLPAGQAQQVLDFIAHLKQAGSSAWETPVGPDNADGPDADWAAFEKLAGTWSGKFDREACYDRSILR